MLILLETMDIYMSGTEQNGMMLEP
jgi:hypothetical protein